MLVGRLSLFVHIDGQPGLKSFLLEGNLSDPRRTFDRFCAGSSHLSTDGHVTQYEAKSFSYTSFDSCSPTHSKICSEDLQRAILSDTLYVVILMT